MASQQGGNDAGNGQQPNNTQGSNPNPASNDITTSATASTTQTPASGTLVAPQVPGAQRGLRRAKWVPEEEDFVFERLSEEPKLGWTRITPFLNAKFRIQQVWDGNQLVVRGDRGVEAVRQHFRLMREELQNRLDAQHEVRREELKRMKEAVALLDAVEAVPEPESSEEEGDGNAQA